MGEGPPGIVLFTGAGDIVPLGVDPIGAIAGAVHTLWARVWTDDAATTAIGNVGQYIDAVVDDAVTVIVDEVTHFFAGQVAHADCPTADGIAAEFASRAQVGIVVITGPQEPRKVFVRLTVTVVVQLVAGFVCDLSLLLTDELGIFTSRKAAAALSQVPRYARGAEAGIRLIDRPVAVIVYPVADFLAGVDDGDTHHFPEFAGLYPGSTHAGLQGVAFGATAWIAFV